jgi:hypothetical protein
MRTPIRLKLVVVVAAVCCATGLLSATPASAMESAPQWTISSASRPTNFKPGGDKEGDEYVVLITNTGSASSSATESVSITDELPEGLSAVAGVSAEDELGAHEGSSTANFSKDCGPTGEGNFNCTYSGVVQPDDTLILKIPVSVAASMPDSCHGIQLPASALSCVDDVVRVSGGGAPEPAMMQTPTTISEVPASFGLSAGTVSTALSSTQAGAHPDITTSVAFNTENLEGQTAGNLKNTITDEPPGFALDLLDTPSCLPAVFLKGQCPVATQVGVTTITVIPLGPELDPVYNLAPEPGEVAKIGFSVGGFFFYEGDVAVRPPGEEGEYGGKVTFYNNTAGIDDIDNVSLTLWGVPSAAIHNPLRFDDREGKGFLGHFGEFSDAPPVPFFSNPTSCTNKPLVATFGVTSWQEPERVVGMEGSVPAPMEIGPMLGCDRLGMEPKLSAEATTNKADAASGLDLNVNIPQTYDDAEGLATSALEKQVVTLPEGITVNPSAGAGLAACTPEQYAAEGVQYVEGLGCPKESKLGEVEITTPLLAEHAKGSVYLAQPAPFGEAGHNPFNSLLALYIVARIPNRGVLVKAPGEVQANPVTGQLVTTFETANPEDPGDGLAPLPFSLLTFRFNQGAGSPLVTPNSCGLYTVTAELTPWSDREGLPLTPPIAPFPITSSFNGGACPSGGTPPFKPQVVSGTEDNNAGAYSPFYLRIVREDGEQEITKFTSVFPPGLTGNLTGIPFCPEADIEAARGMTGAEELEHPLCPVASEIGHTLVGAGVGSQLAEAPGKIYLAGPYHGSALSVVSITAAKVGPFDLGTVVVRFALSINPITAQVEINGANSDPIPHIIKGIVVHVRDIRAYINRSKFIVNPTTCDPSSISETITGAGANPAIPADQMTVGASAPFQAADCSSLKFKPTFKVSTSGKTSRTQGASLSVKLTYPSNSFGTQANIKSVKVDLPKQLPSRLTTLQKACTAAQFSANPAGCPVASRVGQAKAITPILPVPLEGPAYFVSYGGAKFPELVIVLQGYGFTIDLHGETFINKAGITSSTFHTIPDEPVGSFELTLPEGPYSALAANGNFCTSKLTMPTAFTAQNGDTIHQSTPISVTGCPKHKTIKHKHKTKKKTKGKQRRSDNPGKRSFSRLPDRIGSKRLIARPRA